MKQPSEHKYLQPCTEIRRWVECSDQSFQLFTNWLKEVIPQMKYKCSPTSSWIATLPNAVDDICDQLKINSLEDGDLIIEIGPGPGPMPQAILRKTRKKIEYLAIELNSDYVKSLRKRIHDPRFEVVNGNAIHISKIVAERRKIARLVLSSMPFSTNEEVTTSILTQIRDRVLKAQGKLMVWNFKTESIQKVEKEFKSENCQKGRVFFNAPFLRTVLAERPPKPLIQFPAPTKLKFDNAVNQ